MERNQTGSPETEFSTDEMEAAAGEVGVKGIFSGSQRAQSKNPVISVYSCQIELYAGLKHPTILVIYLFSRLSITVPMKPVIPVD